MIFARFRSVTPLCLNLHVRLPASVVGGVFLVVFALGACHSGEEVDPGPGSRPRQPHVGENHDAAVDFSSDAGSSASDALSGGDGAAHDAAASLPDAAAEEPEPDAAAEEPEPDAAAEEPEPDAAAEEPEPDAAVPDTVEPPVGADNGEMCQTASECASGHCSSGVCCESDCTGGCSSCAMAGRMGSCIPLAQGEAGQCPSPLMCNGAGACAAPLGQMCTLDSGCLDNRCVEGLCCAQAGCEPAFDWVRIWQTPGLEKDHFSVWDIDRALNGDVLLSGLFNGGVDFNPGVSTTFQMADSLADGFILRLSARGAFRDLITTTSVGGADHSGGLAVHLDGTIINSGSAGLPSIDLDFTSGEDIRQAAFGNPAFLRAITPNWRYKWGAQLDHDVFGSHIDLEPGLGGATVLFGGFSGRMDFDPGPAQDILDTSSGNTFVALYGETGNLLWRHQFSQPVRWTDVRTVKVSPHDGTIAYAGALQGQHDLDPSSGIDLHDGGALGSIAVVRLNHNGQYLASIVIDTGLKDARERLAYGRDGTLYVTGQFGSELKISGAPTIAAKGAQAAFVAAFDTNGQHLWTSVFDHPDSESALTVEVAPAFPSGVLVAGLYAGTLDLDPGPAEKLVTTAPTQERGFVVRLDKKGGYAFSKTTGGVPTYLLPDKDSEGFILHGVISKTITDLVPGQSGPPVGNGSSEYRDSFLMRFSR